MSVNEVKPDGFSFMQTAVCDPKRQLECCVDNLLDDHFNEKLQQQQEEAVSKMTDKKCLDCGLNIPAEARKCNHCGSRQDWLRYLNTTNLVIAAILAVASLAIPIANFVSDIFKPQKAELTFYMAGKVLLSNFSAKNIFQVSKLKGKINVVNSGSVAASIDSIIVENTGVISQLHMIEGCGSFSFIDIPKSIPADNILLTVNFTVPYTIGFVPQLAIPEIGPKMEPVYLGSSGHVKSIIRSSANIYVYWSDPSGRYLSIVQHKGHKRHVRYIRTEEENLSGGHKDIYCFDQDVREKLGLSNGFGQSKYRVGERKTVRID